MTSTIQKLFITLLAAIALGMFAVILFPFVFMTIVLMFAIKALKRWRREFNFADDDFD